MKEAQEQQSYSLTHPQESIEADVVIVGAGVVGSIMAWKLSQAGLNVVILDAGAKVNKVDAINRYKNDLTKEANSPYKMMPWAPVPDDNDPLSYYVQPKLPSSPNAPQEPKKQIAFEGFFMRLVGGTSWHWTGHAERLFPNDFRMKTQYGVGKDWPISYQDIEPYYHQIEDAWGVAGGPDCIAPSPDIQYPMPEVPRSYLDRVIGKGVKEHNLGPDSQPLPHCRNSVPRDNRPQCCGNASCLPICPIGAKYDASVHVQKAQQLGTRVLANRVVFQVALEEDGKQVKEIYYRNFDADPKTGPIGIARAKTFILAAHAVETARLMLLSAGKFNVPASGLSNSSDQVGRNLMGFANINTLGYASDDMKVYPYRGPVSATGAFGQWRDGEFRSESASIAPFIVNAAFKGGIGPIQEAEKGIEKGLVGEALKHYVDNRTARQINLHSTVEILPISTNRVTLSDQLDPLGLPRPEVNFQLDDYTLRGCKKAWDWHLDVFHKLDIKTITDEPMPAKTDENWHKFVAGEFKQKYQLSLTSGDAVIAGTACMGDDANKAVVNKYSQSFDHNNLYVVGTANYLSVGSASPSLTAAALGLRSAEHIISHFFNASAKESA
ncbi:hypothetical protein OA92_14465 [Marinomonas sp. SBI22]|uniref:GMC oxidoreductase n=1 Tax=unclassified Marinomonas TaxID=196814 RepID=UPI0007AF9177|nr:MULTISPECIES: GMC family oxidoreductase [unclassified Marinomonas]KZM41588.1 hypothetical protein OA92_14465 [Marinomonas sp. SBI22]KZM43424.1 hypothetical protein OA91_12670 [Marinomonas sp. SBI8L]